MNLLLKKAKDIQSEGCVSIIVKTHRTKPDNQHDPVLLKNLVKEAEERLFSEVDKKLALSVMEKLNTVVSGINHNFNLDSLIIFANSDFADYTRLPLQVESRVVIDHTFATRDLVRAMHSESSYYVLVVSRSSARLIEAYNDSVVEEKGERFPVKNETLYATNKQKLSMKQGQDNLIEEFFNRTDKIFNDTVKENPLPVVLVTETRNFEHYLKVADRKDLIAGHVNMNRDNEKAHHIVPEAWKIMQTLLKMKNEARISELKKAVSEGKFVSDYSEIWNAIQHGRGKTIFVRRGVFQPAILTGNEIIPVDGLEKNQTGVIDDIFDEMIEQTMAFGGDVVFVEGHEPEYFENVALITRY
jgi:hypothetical protein